MPEAWAKGSLAYTAMSSVPTKALKQVATNTLLAMAVAISVWPLIT